ncbi:Sodium/calcium exchanger protein-domain-containing protein [Dactylonectria macrodidyma]|uniref:Sodium/calcium exchanger protein-domain-containing protein n=1 Tax=Dactylonectria macrodidyma TaxID=307937 RepID=A0A9P9FPG9_9HYPO|nr:Sodium/calcium exchanger protein-domain-containing protein [Dactylonectria macrodidyma]
MNPVTSSFRNSEACDGFSDSTASSDEADQPDEESSPALFSSRDSPLDGPRSHRHESRGRSSSFREKLYKALRMTLFLPDKLHRRIWPRVHDIETQALTADIDLGDNGRFPARVDTFNGHIRGMLFSSWLNSLLIFVPIGLGTYLFRMSPLLIFTCNALAIVPLSALLTDATERIASDAGDTIGALLNITLGNLVELIIFIALVNNHIRIVQASILGSMLVNLLLILGSALLASNFGNFDSVCDEAESHLLAGLLFVSAFVILMPTAFDYTFFRPGTTNASTLSMSRVSSLIVLVIYILYFAHEMRSRPEKDKAKATPLQSLSPEGRNVMTTEYVPTLHGQDSVIPARTIRFSDRPTETTARSTTRNVSGGVEASLEQMEEAFNENSRRRSTDINTRPGSSHQFFRSRRHSRSYSVTSSRGFHSRDSSLGGGVGGGAASAGRTTLHTIMDSPNPSRLVHEVPHRHDPSERWASVSVLIVSSIVMSMCAEFLVTTIDDVTHEGGLSESVIGLIILPVVGNIAEYVTVVTVAARNKLDLAIAVAVGSAIQIALCVTPLTVIAGWILHRNLELTFNFFETMTLVGTVLLVILLVLNDSNMSPRTSGLKGALMCACYGIIGLGAYLSPPGKE